MQSIKKSIILLLTSVLGLAMVGSADASPSRRALTGVTSVVLNPNYIEASRALGLTTTPVFPATGNTVKPNTPVDALSKDRKVSFPIAGGVLDYKNAFGEIIHTGGLSIRGGSTTVSLTEFVIDTTFETPTLTGLVTANGTLVGRVPLFDLRLPTLQLPLSSRKVKISGVAVRLTKEAADALNSIFGVTAFTEGFRIGHAQVQANFSSSL